MARKFISFKTEKEKEEENKRKELISSLKSNCENIMILSEQLTNSLLVDESHVDSQEYKNILAKIKQEVEHGFRVIGDYEKKTSTSQPPKPVNEYVNHVANSLKTKTSTKEILNSIKNSNDTLDQQIFERIKALTAANSNIKNNVSDESRNLQSGGMAPPQIKKVDDISLGFYAQSKVINEMRKLNSMGQSVTNNSSFKKKPISMKEFADAFSFLEDVKDYTGPFLVKVFKSIPEIESQESSLKLDLTQEKYECSNCDSILINIYDIAGSTFDKESKHFMVLFNFDELTGTLEFKKALLSDNKSDLSERQKNELIKFCKSKNLKHETIR